MTIHAKWLTVGLVIIASAVASASGRTEWLGKTGMRVKAEIFAAADAGNSPVLVIVFHGDAPRTNPTYQYDFAASAAKHLHGVVLAALLRPGYTDGEGDTSDGKRGDATGDNYTPDVLDELDSAARQLKTELHPFSVVLLGHSGGSAIAADLLARDPQLANAAMLLSCICDLPTWRRHMKTLYPYPQWDLPVSSISPLDVVNSVNPRVRVRLVIGEKDDTALPESTQRYADALRSHGIDVSVTTLPGRDHEILLDPAVLSELSRLIAR